jgi:dTDP-4-dehydrorhamnose 3,5-epimerase
MQFIELALPACFELLPVKREDSRGVFVKTFNRELFLQQGLEADFQESYYSVSKQGVLRGLHFQAPPADHVKLVYCMEGSIVDVALDLREGSPTFRQHAIVELNSDKANAVYLAKGIAHGFYVTSSCASVVYNVSSVYSPEHDKGVRWDSADVDWPLSGEPIVSDRDKEFVELKDFTTPFKFEG